MLKIHINGIVQGVGFRPFIYKLAHQLKVKGYVLNSTAGVEIAAQADSAVLEEFLVRIKRDLPPGALINDMKADTIADREFSNFTIKQSTTDSGTTLISPDLAICCDCLRELRDQTDHRFDYSFINCTNCGPRYSIVDSLPYDRPRTSMRTFPLCSYCLEEYKDPMNRRFHAQPVACSDCGPELQLLDADLVPVTGDPLKKTISLLKEGKIVAIKGIGGFHIACDATNESAVNELRTRKGRPHKPFAVMCYPEAVQQLVEVDETQLKMLRSPAAPILILKKQVDNPLAVSTSPMNPHLGVLFPYTPHHFQIITKQLPYLIMTSGNVNNEPIAADENELQGISDYFLTHNRPILNRCDDSIILPAGYDKIMLRRSRVQRYYVQPLQQLYEHGDAGS